MNYEKIYLKYWFNGLLCSVSFSEKEAEAEENF